MERRTVVRLRLAALAGLALVLALAAVLAVALASSPGRHAHGLLVVVAAALFAGVAAGHVRVLLARVRRGADRHRDPPERR